MFGSTLGTSAILVEGQAQVGSMEKSVFSQPKPSLGKSNREDQPGGFLVAMRPPHKTAEVAWAGVPLLNGFVGVW